MILGNGDPSCGWHKSESMQSFAMKTVGVNKPTDFLDFCDTFLDRSHLEECFQGKVETIESKDKSAEKAQSRQNYKIKFMDESAGSLVKAMPVPFPVGVRGNAVRFTGRQVDAIRSGLCPGLTMVVGPPGTGKTDVAVLSLIHI